ncbi:polycomb group protein ASXL1 [Spea bombifrons]|uniref:polycomb group protein ASXL1 n=1 Tax=Spea bombifrons TaxID=233779 RepID=UPI002349E501|nr:polycomb group protein ASXL1 [Spea bombifrons]
MRDRQKRRRERTWAEAARMVLENYSDAPMTPKQILNVIEAEGLKETSGSSPLACLNAMLHSNSRTREALFYKLPGRISLFTMKKNAMQWSRDAPEDGDKEVMAEEKGSPSDEGSAGPAAVEASCSGELHGREMRSLVQVNKQKRRSGVLLPRVVLTPLKVNGAHLPSTSGTSSHRAEAVSTSNRALGGSLNFHRRAALSRDNPHHLRGLRGTPPGQVKKNKSEEIDFETPGSILVNTNLRALINVRTFNALPTNLQQQLLLLLPEVDRQAAPDGQMRMSGSALNNEFFAHACQRWRERLAEGEFTPEVQLRMRQEMGKEKKVEDWKGKFFEEFYGQKLGLSSEPLSDDDDEKRVIPVPKSVQMTSKNPESTPLEKIVSEVCTRAKRSAFRKEAREDQKLAHLDAAETQASASPLPVKAEFLAPEAQIPPRDEVLLPSTSDRVPELHPETSEQKRKNCKPETSSPSLEKKPRIGQRQSFRNTIQSVHTEKPLPTKEEPKVPPIRIQLSRIKPPWLGEGLPAYQICPRIVPDADPVGSRTRSCAPADRQSRGSQSQTSIGGGGGPGGGGTTRKGRTRPRILKRRSSTKRKRKQPPNCCRTQLLSSSALRNKREKLSFPPGQGNHTAGARGSRSKDEGQGVSWGGPFIDTKDQRAADAAVSGALFDTMQGYGGQDALKPRTVQTVPGEVSALLPTVGLHPNKDNSTCFGLVGIDGASPSACAAAEAAPEDLPGVDSVTSVLGDVSNTFQSKPKPIATKVTRREPALDFQGEIVAVGGQPPRLPSESQGATDVPEPPVHAAHTSLSGRLVEACAASWGSSELGMSCDGALASGSLEIGTVSEVLDFQEPRVVLEQQDGPAEPVFETLRCELPAATLVDVSAGAATLSCPSESARDCVGIEQPEMKSRSLAQETDPLIANCGTNCQREANVRTEPHVVASPLPALQKRDFTEKSCLPAVDSSVTLHAVVEKPRIRLKPASKSCPSEALGRDLWSSKFACESFKVTLTDPELPRTPAGDQSPEPRLFNKADPAAEIHQALLMDLRFQKEIGLSVQLPIELPLLPPRQSLKQSSFGKMSWGPKDVASCPTWLTARASLSLRLFADGAADEQISLRCSCSLKAMRMCQGCGAFCHHDCMGPSTLCVLCLVIR